MPLRGGRQHRVLPSQDATLGRHAQAREPQGRHQRPRTQQCADRPSRNLHHPTLQRNRGHRRFWRRVSHYLQAKDEGLEQSPRCPRLYRRYAPYRRSQHNPHRLASHHQDYGGLCRRRLRLRRPHYRVSVDLHRLDQRPGPVLGTLYAGELRRQHRAAARKLGAQHPFAEGLDRLLPAGEHHRL